MLGIALGFSSGMANAAVIIIPVSAVSVVTQTGNSTWDYQFTVINSGFYSSINQLALPYFSDAGIANISSPTGWTGSVNQYFNSTPISNLVPFGTENAVVWSTNSNTVNMLERLSGFSFTSSYAPVYGPYALGFSNGYSFIGDPGIPGSPLATAAGYTTSYPVTAVPEPETYGMMLGGLGLMGLMLRRKNSA